MLFSIFFLRKVIEDPKYGRRAREHGSLLMDDINKPLDRAIWWLEYALRHPGWLILVIKSNSGYLVFGL